MADSSLFDAIFQLKFTARMLGNLSSLTAGEALFDFISLEKSSKRCEKEAKKKKALVVQYIKKGEGRSSSSIPFLFPPLVPPISLCGLLF